MTFFYFVCGALFGVGVTVAAGVFLIFAGAKHVGKALKEKIETADREQRAQLPLFKRGESMVYPLHGICTLPVLRGLSETNLCMKISDNIVTIYLPERNSAEGVSKLRSAEVMQVLAQFHTDKIIVHNVSDKRIEIEALSDSKDPICDVTFSTIKKPAVYMAIDFYYRHEAQDVYSRCVAAGAGGIGNSVFVTHANRHVPRYYEFLKSLDEHKVSAATVLLARILGASNDVGALKPFILSKLKKKLEKVRMPHPIKGTLEVADLKLGKNSPAIGDNIKVVNGPIQARDGGVELALDIEYGGGLELSLLCELEIDSVVNVKIPSVTVKVSVQQLAGTLRVLLLPPPAKDIWIAFETTPKLKLGFTQKINGGGKIVRAIAEKIPDLSDTITDVVRNSILDDMVLPERDDIPLPILGDTPPSTPVNEFATTSPSSADEKDEDSKKQRAIFEAFRASFHPPVSPAPPASPETTKVIGRTPTSTTAATAAAGGGGGSGSSSFPKTSGEYIPPTPTYKYQPQYSPLPVDASSTTTTTVPKKTITISSADSKSMSSFASTLEEEEKKKKKKEAKEKEEKEAAEKKKREEQEKKEQEQKKKEESDKKEESGFFSKINKKVDGLKSDFKEWREEKKEGGGERESPRRSSIEGEGKKKEEEETTKKGENKRPDPIVTTTAAPPKFEFDLQSPASPFTPSPTSKKEEKQEEEEEKTAEEEKKEEEAEFEKEAKEREAKELAAAKREKKELEEKQQAAAAEEEKRKREAAEKEEADEKKRQQEEKEKEEEEQEEKRKREAAAEQEEREQREAAQERERQRHEQQQRQAAASTLPQWQQNLPQWGSTPTSSPTSTPSSTAQPPPSSSPPAASTSTSNNEAPPAAAEDSTPAAEPTAATQAPASASSAWTSTSTNSQPQW